MIFKDRKDAGKQLAKALTDYHEVENGIILALPRGGVPVAYEVAQQLNLPLDITCPHKIGAPFNPEYAIGAITERGEPLLNQHVIESLGVPEEYLMQAIENEREAARAKLRKYRADPTPSDLADKVVILVDDGLATGSTMRAAIASVKGEKPKKVVVAVPVSPPETAAAIAAEVDALICLSTPAEFYAVGQFYEDFGQTTDEEVIACLRKS